ncbi:MAG: LuxR C-terminal-related transcriptional regulator, partial [Dehalococcoidia bacterium]
TNMVGAPPLWPWREILSQLPDSDLIVNALEQMRSEVVDDELSEASEVRRFELFSGVLATLRDTAVNEPLLICIDDMQWADTTSQDLFSFVASQLGQHSVLMTACLRTSANDLQPASRAMLSSINRLNNFVRIEPRVLESEEIRELVETAVNHTVTREVVAQIAAQTKGVPLFVKELASSIGPRGQILTSVMPDSIADIFGSRIDELSPDAQQVVSTAAVLGSSFRADDILAIMQDSDGHESGSSSIQHVLSAIDEASVAGAVRSAARESGAFEFTHPLYAEVARDRLPARSRAAMHATTAGMLEDSYGDDAAIHASELAWHYKQATPVSGSEKMVYYSLIAGQSALRSFAWAEALEHFESVRAVVESDPKSIELAHAWFGIARARYTYESKWGSSLTPREIETGLEAAFDIYVNHGETGLAIEVASQGIVSPGGWIPSSRMTDRALELLDEDSFVASRLLTRRGDVLWRTSRDESISAFDRALELAEKHDDSSAQIKNLRIQAQFQNIDLHYEKVLALSNRAFALQQLSPKIFDIALLNINAGIALASLGDLDEADKKLEAGRSAGAELGYELNLYHSSRANLETKRANFAEVIRHARELERLEDAPALPLFEVTEEGFTGDLKVALKNVRRLVAEAPSIPATQGFLAVHACMIAWLGDELGDEDVLNEAAELGALVEIQSNIDTITLNSLVQLKSMVAIGLGQVDQARELYEELLPQKDSFNLRISGQVTDLVLGQLSETFGEIQQAVDHFELALEFCKNGGIVTSECETSRAYAATLLERGSRVDRAKAIELLQDGIALAERHKLKHLGESMSAMLNTATVGKTLYPAGLTSREVDVARLLIDGKTNPQIAEELFISPNTVLRHVSNIFGKLDVSSRTEAAIKAVELGLAEKK